MKDFLHKKIYFLVIPVLIFSSINRPLVGAQIDSVRIEKFYQDLYNYRFLSADSMLKNLCKKGISSQITGILQISFSWWEIISGENSSGKIDSLFKTIDNEIALIENKPRNSVYSQNEILQLIVLYSYKSRLHNLENNRLAGFNAFKQSFKYFEELMPCDSGNCDMYNFIAGMYYALGGHLQQQFTPFFLLGIDRQCADTTRGYKLLHQSASSQNQQIRTESTYFLMKLYNEVQVKPDIAEKYSRQLINQFPDNLVFRFNHILLLYDQGKFKAAETHYQKLLTSSEKNQQLTVRQKQHFRDEYRRLND